MSSSVQRGEAPLFRFRQKTCRASLDWTDEDICPYVVRGDSAQDASCSYFSTRMNSPVLAFTATLSLASYWLAP
jgi:hypothetical protein